MKHNKNLVTVILFLVLIIGGGLAFVLCPDKTFSENENRYLTEKPEISGEKLITGEYMEDFEEYVSDQFPMRDILMSISSDYRYLMGMRDINGVYVASDGYLMTKTEKSDVDYARINKNTGYINEFFERYKGSIGSENICFMLIPEAAMVLKDRLPAFADSDWEKDIMEEIRGNIENAAVTEPEKAFPATDRELYYKTDHHWTVFGAFAAYRQYANLYGKTPDESEYNFTRVTDSFRGSLYSKVLLSKSSMDEISVYTDGQDTQIKGDGESLPLYDYEALNRKDKYGVFLGGNYGLVEIEGKGEGNLLIIKDSFANSFVPFLIDDYAKIIMVDLRYYMGDINLLTESENIDRILVMYQFTNFISDENLIKLVF